MRCAQIFTTRYLSQLREILFQSMFKSLNVDRITTGPWTTSSDNERITFRKYYKLLTLLTLCIMQFTGHRLKKKKIPMTPSNSEQCILQKKVLHCLHASICRKCVDKRCKPKTDFCTVTCRLVQLVQFANSRQT